MRTRNSDLRRRSLGGGRVRCREYVPIKKRHIRSRDHVIYNDLLIRHRLYVAWPGGRVSASAYCGWWRSLCALQGPNKVETAVQCSVCRI